MKRFIDDEDDWELIRSGPLMRPSFDNAPRNPILTAAPKHAMKHPRSFDSSAPHSLEFFLPVGTPKRLPDNLDNRPDSVSKLTDIRSIHSTGTPTASDSQSRARNSGMGTSLKSDVLTRAKKPSDIGWIVQLWVEILKWFGQSSALFVEIEHSDRFRYFAAVILDAFAPSTMAKYLTCLQSFCKTCDDLGIHIQDISAIQVLDIMQMGKRNVGASGGLLLKSLRRVFKNANISCLSVMDSSLLVHWEKSKIPHDRGEALPLPLYVIVSWERRLLEKRLHHT